MAERKNGKVQYVQQEQSDYLTSGNHVFGPFASGGVSSVALMYDTRSGVGGTSCVVNVQRSLSPPLTPDADIIWSDAYEVVKGSIDPTVGEFQSSFEFAPDLVASLWRATIEVPAGEAIRLFWMAGARNI